MRRQCPHHWDVERGSTDSYCWKTLPCCCASQWRWSHGPLEPKVSHPAGPPALAVKWVTLSPSFHLPLQSLLPPFARFRHSMHSMHSMRAALAPPRNHRNRQHRRFPGFHWQRQSRLSGIGRGRGSVPHGTYRRRGSASLGLFQRFTWSLWAGRCGHLQLGTLRHHCGANSLPSPAIQRSSNCRAQQGADHHH